MNIKILTFIRAHNYGAYLQAFALSEHLQKNDNNVEFVDYRVKKIEDAYKPFNIKGLTIKGIARYIRYFIPINKKYRTFNNEIKKFHLTKSVYTTEEIERLNSCTNAYITGSDQVWNKSIVGDLSDIYSLNFDSSKAKKISYAASVGDVNLIINNKDEYKNKLNNIDYISVREEDAKKELTKVLDRNVEVVIDPTLLLTRQDWDKYISNIDIEKQKYIFAYVVAPDEEYIKIANDLSNKTGLPIIHCGLRNPGYKNVLKTIYTKSPFDFVAYIKNAEYVVATSFHATAFSIIYNKKFFIVPHKKTGSRVTNLLKKLDVEGRTYSSFEDFKNIDYDFETDWKKVNRKLDDERLKSIEWLDKALKE